MLLHGFGGNALHWRSFAPLLTDRFRVVAPDLRGHGRSGDGPLSWDALVSDLERVVQHLGFDRPAVAGHSLGGGVAAWWARRHPECPGAVDLDGTRGVETVPENLPGLDPAVARARVAELTATFQAQAAAMAGPLTEEAQAAIRGQYSDVEMFERNLVRDGAGRVFVRPGAEAVSAFREQLMEVDLFEVFGAARCPLLICASTRNLPGTEPFAELAEAHRRGVARDLAAAARANPLVRVEHLAASHNLVHEIPDELAAVVRDFLS